MATVERVTFYNRTSREFSKTVKQRVDQYFKTNKLSPHANLQMVVKTVIMLTLYLGSYALIISDQFSLGTMWFLTFIMGIAAAGIGFSISHDALHAAYSSSSTVNRALGFTFDMLGANDYIWKITHNIIHHTYTNIHGHDEEFEVAGVYPPIPTFRIQNDPPGSAHSCIFCLQSGNGILGFRQRL